ncbi:fluoride efflux transporter CrcB [Acetobacter sp. AN02]|uniref:fluoride efflux transporter CrcB n=1 Tax=Acetobacter sp. AN02 TaxID=2894186 RepID=UPI00243443C4|nr:fluoride efflux transporter CrcB [Acetobacter sp. AN02]MDG6095413.1 fluoride efflux transporter CrcB [Acetobacter sp. AN02]
MPANFPSVLLIALGGAAGTLLRYWGTLALARWSQSFPWSTILINAGGSFAIAFFAGLTAPDGRIPAPDAARLFFMVGVCGGFTTFSSFSLQTLDLLRSGFPLRALLNILLSVALCMATVSAGWFASVALSADRNNIH